MSNVTSIPSPVKTIRQQAEEEVRKEAAERALTKMKSRLRDLEAAKAVVKAIELQIVDLEIQINDGVI